jgi:hypothetical protein
MFRLGKISILMVVAAVMPINTTPMITTIIVMGLRNEN